MKKLNLLLLVIIIFYGCSPIQIKKDVFDNSYSIKLDDNYLSKYLRLDGELDVETILFSKEYKKGKMSEPIIFLKFIGYNGDILEGNSIEINLDGKIYKIQILESRFAQYVKIQTSGYTNYTYLGSFTFADTTRTNVNILAFEAPLNNEIRNEILKSNTFMIRFYTKNINGVSKNVFQSNSPEIKDIKEFVKIDHVIIITD